LQLQEAIADELNVKSIKAAEHLDDLVSYSYKPNLKTLGPKYGKLLGVIRKELPEMDAAILDPLRKGETIKIELSGNELELGPDDVLVSTEQAADWASADDAGIQIALSTKLTPELEREGIARDFVRQVQQLRKDHDLEIENRININYQTDNETILAALEEWQEYIGGETLADSIASGSTDNDVKQVQIGDEKVAIWIEKA